jgi:hypothetical protein
MTINLRSTLAAMVATFVVALALMPAGAADARSKGSSSKPRGCPVVDENDNVVEYVEVGTRVGLMFCGADGEWHFGWPGVCPSCVKSKAGDVSPPEEGTKVLPEAPAVREVARAR